MAKKPWQSKTVLLNALMGGVSAVALFFPKANVVTDWVQSNMAIIGMVWGAVGIALRFATKEKIVLVD